jgi:hypothetical protein
MLPVVLIGVSLVLLGIVGLQFMYLFYIDRVFRERKKYLQQLEHRSDQLEEKLAAANKRIAEQNELLEAGYPRSIDEVWAEVIDEH